VAKYTCVKCGRKLKLLEILYCRKCRREAQQKLPVRAGKRAPETAVNSYSSGTIVV